MLDYEKLDVYRVALEFAAWAYRLAQGLKGPDRHAKDQLTRASQSIVLNVAEGTGKRSRSDRCRFYEIARGSAFESGATLDILVACDVLHHGDVAGGHELLHRLVSMLTKLTRSRDRDGAGLSAGGKRHSCP